MTRVKTYRTQFKENTENTSYPIILYPGDFDIPPEPEMPHYNARKKLIHILTLGIFTTLFRMKNPFEEYERKKKEYIKVKERNVDKIFLDTYRKKDRLLKATNSPYKPTKIINNNIKKGKLEEYFFQFLSQLFPNKILRGYTIVERKHLVSNLYVPDFVYFDEKTNIILDIEIDEPYSADENSTSYSPIHFYGKDDSRNLYFTNQGWTVVRFAEEQVAKYPLRCCKKIENIIEELKGNKSDYCDRLLKNYADLPLVKQWNYFDVKDLIQSNYRENYLKLVSKVKYDYLLSEGKDKFVIRKVEILNSKKIKSNPPTAILEFESSKGVFCMCYPLEKYVINESGEIMYTSNGHPKLDEQETMRLLDVLGNLGFHCGFESDKEFEVQDLINRNIGIDYSFESMTFLKIRGYFNVG